MEREHILKEIRRTAEANGGVPLGRGRFESEAGIREGDWLGRYWARWSDALAEAGYAPNVLQERYPDDAVLGSLVGEIRRLGRMPTLAELKLRRRQDRMFPSHGVFERLGPKATWAAAVARYCAERPDCEDGWRSSLR